MVAACLRDNSEQVRAEAAKALEAIGPATVAIPWLLDCLSDPARQVAEACSRTLRGFRQLPRRFQPKLRTLLAKAPKTARHLALSLLSEVAPLPSLLPQLTAALKSDDPAERALAAGALQHMGPAARAAGQELRIAVLDSEPGPKTAALGALASIDPYDPIVLRQMISRFQTHPGLSTVARTLMQMGIRPHSGQGLRRHAAKRLRQWARTSPEPTMRIVSTIAAGLLAGKHPSPTPRDLALLGANLQSSEPANSIAAALLLSTCGKKGAPALAMLRSKLAGESDSKNADIYQFAIDTIEAATRSAR
jgi:hypothetical protein